MLLPHEDFSNRLIYPAYIHSDTIHFMVEQEYRFFQSCGSCLYWGLGKILIAPGGPPWTRTRRS